MTPIPLVVKDDFEHLEVSTQVDVFGNSPINHAFTAVAQEVARLLQHIYPPQADGINHPKMMTYDWSETITIQVSECRQIIDIEPLTERELEVLHLIVDGDSNSAIAGNLDMTEGTVKLHVCNIFKKLCVSDRTQAAIRALRSGLVH